MKLKIPVKIIIFLLILIVFVFFLWQKILIEERELEIKKPISLELVVDGLRYQTTTEALTIGDFFQEKNLSIYSKDLIIPDLEREIRPGMVISVVTNRKVLVEVDGEVREINTIKKTIEKMLEEADIKLNPFDQIKPSLESLTKQDLEVVITRIEKKNIIEEEKIEYKTIIKEDKKVKWKKIEIQQEGEDGLKEVEYELIYKNGELISKTKLSSKIIKESQPKIIVEGRKIEIVSTQKGRASWYAYTGEMKCASVRYSKGTWLRVTNQENGKQIIVQVNDYGPDPGTGKVIDLDKVAFAKLANIGQGVIEVKIEEIESAGF
jgi:uncharacterized protein YabE (DUF348 family)